MAYLGISGPGRSTPDEEAAAAELGRLAARAGHVVVCGGLGGVMGAAARGVRDAGGTSVGLLPGPDRRDAHPALTVAVPTGLGELRNGLLVRASDVLLCVGGSWGTLSELALAVRTGVPVVALGTWLPPEAERDPARPVVVGSVREAWDALVALLPPAPTDAAPHA